MVLELAVASRSKYIVTYNLCDFKGINNYFGIEAITPAIFLHKLRNKDYG